MSTIDNCATRFPDPLGVKLTDIVHWLLAGSDVPQVLVAIAKSPEFVPVSEMLVMVTGATPLVIVTVCAVLVVPRVWGANTKPVGLIAIPSRAPIFETNASQSPP